MLIYLQNLTSHSVRESQKKSSDVKLNNKSVEARLGLARVLKCSTTDLESDEMELLYREVIEMAPDCHDAYIELGELLCKTKPMEAVEVYRKFPFSSELSCDDGYLYGEMVRLLIKERRFDDADLKRFMIGLGKISGFSSLEKYVTVLENELKYNSLLREVYAGINGKSVDDIELKAFFKFKLWE